MPVSTAAIDLSSLSAAKVWERLNANKAGDFKWVLCDTVDGKKVNIVATGDAPLAKVVSELMTDDKLLFLLMTVVAEDKASTRTKLVLFTIMGSSVPFSAKKSLREVNTAIASYASGHALHTEVHDPASELTEAMIEKELLRSCGAFKPTGFAFPSGTTITKHDATNQPKAAPSPAKGAAGAASAGAGNATTSAPSEGNNNGSATTSSNNAEGEKKEEGEPHTGDNEKPTAAAKAPTPAAAAKAPTPAAAAKNPTPAAAAKAPTPAAAAKAPTPAAAAKNPTPAAAAKAPTPATANNDKPSAPSTSTATATTAGTPAVKTDLTPAANNAAANMAAGNNNISPHNGGNARTASTSGSSPHHNAKPSPASSSASKPPVAPPKSTNKGSAAAATSNTAGEGEGEREEEEEDATHGGSALAKAAEKVVASSPAVAGSSANEGLKGKTPSSSAVGGAPEPHANDGSPSPNTNAHTNASPVPGPSTPPKGLASNAEPAANNSKTTVPSPNNALEENDSSANDNIKGPAMTATGISSKPIPAAVLASMAAAEKETGGAGGDGSGEEDKYAGLTPEEKAAAMEAEKAVAGH